MALHSVVHTVTERIISRSRTTRGAYLARSRAAYGKKVERSHLGCTNLAHAFAAMPNAEKQRSEEHTSELQSLMRISYAVFCLKKKKQKNNNTPNNTNSTQSKT